LTGTGELLDFIQKPLNVIIGWKTLGLLVPLASVSGALLVCTVDWRRFACASHYGV
jgi:hypothetical protein